MVTFSGVCGAVGLMDKHLVLNQVAWSKAPAVKTTPARPDASRLVKVVLSPDLLVKVPQGFCVPSAMFTVYVSAQAPTALRRTTSNRISFCFMLV